MNYSFLQISKATITAVSVFAVLNSCVKKKIDFDNLADQQLTPEIALPLVNSSFTIKDILSKSDNNGNVSIDPNTNFCTLVYKGELFSVKATDIITLMNQSANTSYSLTPKCRSN